MDYNDLAAALQQQRQQQQEANQLSASGMSMMMMNQQHPMRAPPPQEHQQHLQNLMMTHGQVVQPPMESILQQQLMMPPPAVQQQQQQQQFGANLFGQFPFTGSAFASAIDSGDVSTASHEALLAAIQRQQQQQELTQQRQQFQQHQQQNAPYTERLFNVYGEGGESQSQHHQQQPSGDLGGVYNIQRHLGHGSTSLPSDQQAQQLSGGMFGGGFMQLDPHFSAASSQIQQQFPEGLVADRRSLHQEQFMQNIPQNQLQQQAQMISRTAFLNLPQHQQQELLQHQLFQRRRSSLGSTASDMSPLSPVGLTIQRPSLATDSAAGFTSLASFSQAQHQPPSLQTTQPQQLSLFQPTHEYQANFPQPSTSFFRAGGGIANESILAQSLPGDKIGGRTKRAKTFPEKLMEALVRFGDDEVVAWLPDGKSFVVVKPDEFVAHVLSPIFKQAKYTSFVRKLHRWGFVRLTSGTGTDCFHHPLFNRNRRDLASKITVAAATQKSRPEKVPPSLAGVERFAQRKKAIVETLPQKVAPEKVKELEQDETHRPAPSSELGDTKPAVASPFSSLGPTTMDSRLDKLGTVAAGYSEPTTALRGLLSSGHSPNHGALLGSPVAASLPERKTDDSPGTSSTDASPSQKFQVERTEI